METISRKVALHGIRFFAYHGFYPEEQLVGGTFIVDVETSSPVTGDGEDELANTVNYEQLFAITSSRMKQTQKLLETVAYAIMDDIRRDFAFVTSIRVCISKMNPPMQGEIGRSVVEFTYSC